MFYKTKPRRSYYGIIKKYFKKSGGLFGLIKREDESRSRLAKLQIKGEDSFGVLMRILDIICNEHKINIRDLHVTSEGKLFHCDVELIVYKQKIVSQMCMKLREIESVTAVNVVAME